MTCSRKEKKAHLTTRDVCHQLYELVNDLQKELEQGGRLISHAKMLLAEAVRLEILSLEEASRRFSLHEETVLTWVEELQDPDTKVLEVSFLPDIDMTPLCAKLLAAAQNVHTPLTVGAITSDVALRTCSVAGSIE